MGDDDDDMSMTTTDSGVVEWSDSDGSTGSITSAGSTVENPDGSTTAIDAQGNEVHFDADGNYTETLAGQSGGSRAAAAKAPGPSDSDFRLPSDIREPDWSN